LKSLSYTFPKSERLSSKKLIDSLFRQGDSFNVYPLRVLYLADPSKAANKVRVLITVPRRNLKRAVDRNKVKRRIREAYRLNKHLLYYNQKQVPYLLAYIYISRDVLSYAEIEAKLKVSLERLKNKISQKS